MNKPTLIIGNKNYSSWSLRGWLALHAFGIEFNEVQIELFSESAKPILNKYSPTGKVPALMIPITNNEADYVWDSLAIANFMADKTGLPMWGKHKAECYSLTAEMHSGFMALRSEMPMNIRATRHIKPSENCLKDIARIEEIFTIYRNKYENEGDYLLGKFSIADAFFAPLAFRFKTYNQHSGIELNSVSMRYVQTLLDHPSIQLWQQQALTETTVIQHDEIGEDV